MKYPDKLFLALSVLVLIVSCSKSPEELLVGEWSGTDNKGRSGTFQFYEDGSAELVLGDRVINGQKIGGKVSWRVDNTQDPIHLGLVLKIPSKDSKTLPMIIQFNSDQEIKVGLITDFSSRPVGFSGFEKMGRNRYMTMTKQ